MNIVSVIAQVMIFVATASLCDALASPQKESKLLPSGAVTNIHICGLVDGYRKTEVL